jgi:diguanylate cyclase (GGDEF)-like protein
MKPSGSPAISAYTQRDERSITEAKPLARALDRSEQVKQKVEQCAAELSSVNAVLKHEPTEDRPLADVGLALSKSERVEVKVQECAQELATVNDALAEEIDLREDLGHELLMSNAALVESQAQEERSQHLALHDALTGLPNSTLFDDRLDHALVQAQRHAWRLAVMFIDLDRFKSINDTYGHDIGDRVLQMVAQRLRSVVRAEDTLARRGGDEFLFLMMDAKDETVVEKLAAKIGHDMAEVCEIEGVTFNIRPSIGIALYPRDGRSAQELLKHADVAMYAAKQHAQSALKWATALDQAPAGMG